MMNREFVTGTAALLLLYAAHSQAQGFAEEERDWGVAPRTTLRV